MKNDRRFLSGSDEELIQALESLLQQKAPDQDAVHAILDELDRRSNASALIWNVVGLTYRHDLVPASSNPGKQAAGKHGCALPPVSFWFCL